MSRIAVLGEQVAVEGFGLAGALVLVADGVEAVRAAWRALPVDVAVVILSPAADAALPARATDGPLTVVMPG
ncbi:MAG TPA: hypothetical protein VFR67_00360 [Pilimelia sp.]|nr:hypothetical protein [Pilimelia sp.]